MNIEISTLAAKQMLLSDIESKIKEVEDILAKAKQDKEDAIIEIIYEETTKKRFWRNLFNMSLKKFPREKALRIYNKQNASFSPYVAAAKADDYFATIGTLERYKRLKKILGFAIDYNEKAIFSDEELG
jgi:hypothetical protein